MKIRVLLAALAALLVLSQVGCIDPKDRRPGLRLSAEVVAGAVADWSFSDAHQEIYLETPTWYGVPHSVTTVCAAIGDTLYVPSVYFAGGQWPGKFWNRNVVSNPHVRLEIGGQIYEREAVIVEDPAEAAAAVEALAAKYDFWKAQVAKPEAERFDRTIIRMDARRS
ncbi:MAG: hypothetical protein ACI8W3_000044 [Myxococcota bacterium]|jgi:hypothetical protein